jgi:hypothetical protein
MYWFRQNPFDFLPWLLIAALWITGGWLLVTHVFRLDKRERVISGVGLGLLAYLWTANVLGHWLSAQYAFTWAGILIFLSGAASAWKSKAPLLNLKDLTVWKALLIGLILIAVFVRIGKGISLFDEHKNLSLISTMGAGNIPPRYFMNSLINYAYHYGFQMLGASLMQIGGLTPWSAFDLSKAFIGTLAVMLSYLIGRRYTNNELGGIVLAGALLFATGTRYLMLFLPPTFLQSFDPLLELQGSAAELGVSFSGTLTQPWLVDGGPPLPFPFGYMNGITSWPLFVAAQAGPSTMALSIFLMIWLLHDRTKGVISIFILSILFALWALSWETSYALFIAGVGLVTIYQIWKQRDRRKVNPIFIALLISIPLAIIQGGIITEMVRSLLLPTSTAGIGEELLTSTSLGGFFFRWPLAIVSSHLGSLEILNPPKLLVALFEIGPLIFFAPWITYWSWTKFRSGDVFLGALIISTWIGFSVPILIGYKADRDITRLMAYALQAWLILFVLMFWELAPRLSKTWRSVCALGAAGMIFGGLIITGSALTAATQGVLPYQFISLDAQASSEWWDELPVESEIFDPATWRSAALFGRLNRTSYTANVFAVSDETKALRSTPYVDSILNAGYSYMYIDENWWEAFPEASQASLSQACVRVLSKYEDNSSDKFRMLLDLNACRL